MGGWYGIYTNSDIDRFAGRDSSGTLDIGQSKNLIKRLSQAHRTIFGDTVYGHMAAWRCHHLALAEYYSENNDELMVLCGYSKNPVHAH